MDHDKPLSKALEREITEFSGEISHYEVVNRFEDASEQYVELAQRARANMRRGSGELPDAGRLREIQVDLTSSFAKALQSTLDTYETFEKRVRYVHELMNNEIKSRHEHLALILHPEVDPTYYSPNALNELVETALLLHEQEPEALIGELFSYYQADTNVTTADIIEELQLFSPSERRFRAIKRFGLSALRLTKIAGEHAGNTSAALLGYVRVSDERPSLDQPRTLPRWQSGHLGLHE